MIDVGSPMNFAEPRNAGLRYWGVCLPGVNSGAKQRDLTSPSDYTTGRHGTLTGITQGSASGWTGSNRPGGFGAIALDGTDDFVLIPSLGIVTTAGYSMTCWARTTTTASNQTAIAISRVGQSDSHFRILMTSGGQWSANWIDSAGTQSSAGAGGTANVWTHLGATYFPATSGILLMINGQRAATASATGSQNAFTGASIGTLRYTSNLQFFSGQIDDARFYARPLIDAEFFDNYLQSRAYYPTCLNRIDRTYRKYFRGASVDTGGGGSTQPPRTMHQFRMRGAA